MLFHRRTSDKGHIILLQGVTFNLNHFQVNFTDPGTVIIVLKKPTINNKSPEGKVDLWWRMRDQKKTTLFHGPISDKGCYSNIILSQLVSFYLSCVQVNFTDPVTVIVALEWNTSESPDYTTQQ